MVNACASICPDAELPAGAAIGSLRQNVRAVCHMAGFNTWGVTGYLCDDGLIINIGCAGTIRDKRGLWGSTGLPPDDMIRRVIEKHGNRHLYISLIMCIEEWAAGQEQKLSNANNKERTDDK